MKTAHNMEFGKMPASEYMLNCISLFSFSFNCRITDELWNIKSALYLYSTSGPATVTRTIGTSPSSGRCVQPTMTSFPTTLNNREIVYINISPDLSEVSKFPCKNWLLVAIADREQISLLPRFAELCIDRNVLYVCGAGEIASEIDDEFDIVSVNRAIEVGKNFDDRTFEDAPMTTWHASFEEAFWFGTTTASHETLPIDKVIVANLTNRNYKELVGEIIIQIHSGWLPPD